ncbi:MAG: hypothetical protein AAF799_10675 [Myxococcota bacterium]
MDLGAERLLSLVENAGGFEVSRPRPFCAVLQPREPTERDFLHQDLLRPEHREAFFSVVDEVGLVVVRGVAADPSRYRDVRGRSSRGRLSQGEYYHHDGCSGPTKPRVVEIRCPHQPVARTIATAVAPFPATLYSMLRELPPQLRSREELAPWCEQLDAQGRLPEPELDMVQGLATRAVRKSLGAADARSYFRGVDQRCEAFDEPWQRGESRFIANANAGRTMQHRRAYAMSHDELGPSGKLLKRWPADPGVLDGPAQPSSAPGNTPS